MLKWNISLFFSSLGVTGKLLYISRLERDGKNLNHLALLALQLPTWQPPTFFLSIYELNDSSRKEISADLTITFLLRYKHQRRNCVIECLFNCSFGSGFCQGSLLPILFSHHYSIINLVCSKTVVLLTFQISSEFEINYSHPLSHTRSNSSNLAVSHMGWANAQPAHAQLAHAT